jgi:hypothetical protein
MKQRLWASLVFAMVLSACNNTVPSADPAVLSSKTQNRNEKSDDKKKEDDHSENDKDENKTRFLNDISIEPKGGVEVYRTFLSFESGDLVPSSNVTSLGKPVFLNLNITKGWKEDEGTVSLGASERISSDNGTVFLDEPDLFQNYNSISAEDAKFIRLKAVVNSKTGPIKYFVVDFKVWDKNGDGVITGSYKFYVE